MALAVIALSTLVVTMDLTVLLLAPPALALVRHGPTRLTADCCYPR